MSGARAMQTTLAKPAASVCPGLVLQRQCACGGSAGLSGQCEACQREQLLGKPLQRKLAIHEPGDEYEREADRVADAVMRMPEPVEWQGVTRAPSAPLLQRRISAGQSAGPSEAPRIVHEVLASPGQPLDARTLAFFEPRLGYDLASVRVHADDKAAASARSIDALAYTVGSHLVFGAGQYASNTERGRRLLAHEMVHVHQQTGTGVSGIQRAPILSSSEWSDAAQYRDTVEPWVWQKIVADVPAARAQILEQLDSASEAEPDVLLKQLVKYTALDLMRQYRTQVLAKRAAIEASGPEQQSKDVSSVSEAARKLSSSMEDRMTLRVSYEHLNELARSLNTGFSTLTEEMVIEIRNDTQVLPSQEIEDLLADFASIDTTQEANWTGLLYKLAEARKRQIRDLEREMNEIYHQHPFLAQLWVQDPMREKYGSMLGDSTGQIVATGEWLGSKLRAADPTGVLSRIDSAGRSAIHGLSGPYLSDFADRTLGSNAEFSQSVAAEYDQFIASIDDAIGLIGSEAIDPFELPEAASVARDGLALRPDLQLLLDKSIEHQKLWEIEKAIGLTALQTALALLPVLGEAALIASEAVALSAGAVTLGSESLALAGEALALGEVASSSVIDAYQVTADVSTSLVRHKLSRASENLEGGVLGALPPSELDDALVVAGAVQVGAEALSLGGVRDWEHVLAQAGELAAPSRSVRDEATPSSVAAEEGLSPGMPSPQKGAGLEASVATSSQASTRSASRTEAELEASVASSSNQPNDRVTLQDSVNEAAWVDAHPDVVTGLAPERSAKLGEDGKHRIVEVPGGCQRRSKPIDAPCPVSWGEPATVKAGPARKLAELGEVVAASEAVARGRMTVWASEDVLQDVSVIAGAADIRHARNTVGAPEIAGRIPAAVRQKRERPARQEGDSQTTLLGGSPITESAKGVVAGVGNYHDLVMKLTYPHQDIAANKPQNRGLREPTIALALRDLAGSGELSPAVLDLIVDELSPLPVGTRHRRLLNPTRGKILRTREQLKRVAFLLFVKESERDPANLVHAMMMVDLIAEGGLTFDNALSNWYQLRWLDPKGSQLVRPHTRTIEATGKTETLYYHKGRVEPIERTTPEGERIESMEGARVPFEITAEDLFGVDKSTRVSETKTNTSIIVGEPKGGLLPASPPGASKTLREVAGWLGTSDPAGLSSDGLKSLLKGDILVSNWLERRGISPNDLEAAGDRIRAELRRFYRVPSVLP